MGDIEPRTASQFHCDELALDDGICVGARAKLGNEAAIPVNKEGLRPSATD